LVGDHLLFRDFGTYGIIFMDVCAVITVALVMLLRDFGSYGMIFMNVCVATTVAMTMTVSVYYFRFSRHS
jgi:hypothetical protein